jgi:hypothetical protein
LIESTAAASCAWMITKENKDKISSKFLRYKFISGDVEPEISKDPVVSKIPLTNI